MPEQRKQVDWTAIQAMAENGMPLREIATRLQIPIGTVLSRCSREHWNLRELRSGPKSPVQKRAIANQTLQAGRDYFRDASAISRANHARACVTASQHFADMDGSQLEQKSLPWSASVKNSERVFGWNQQTQQEKEHFQNLHVRFLSIHPAVILMLQLQGRVAPNASFEERIVSAEALSQQEHSRLVEAYNEQPEDLRRQLEQEFFEPPLEP